jgi:hypothetical protein
MQLGGLAVLAQVQRPGFALTGRSQVAEDGAQNHQDQQGEDGREDGCEQDAL